ncbi:MAG TPA: enoyl-CoA hydratase/isomerase family protein [Planctomycetia bacterium]|nr:enoyl-CoA hydratase/isomerase family protein [Planctomycetia bacterium]
MAAPIRLEMLVPGVVGVTLDRAERRNALSIELMEALCDAFDRLASEPANRVVILQGAGPVFSAGLDLREAVDDSLIEKSAHLVERTLRTVRESPLVSIAAVQGGAFAGGAGLMLACDIVIAAEDAKIGFPEPRRGLLPALICSVLRTKVREGDLRDLLLTGDAIDAGRAQGLGLVQRLVPANRLLEEAQAVANSLLAGGPETLRQTKKLIAAVFSASEAGEEALAGLHLGARRSPEAREGLAAFLEKREPNWMRKPGVS